MLIYELPQELQDNFRILEKWTISMNLWKSCIWENLQTIFDKFESFQKIRRLFSRVSAIFFPQVKQKLIIMTGKLMYECFTMCGTS